MILDELEKYDRIDNIIYENGIAIIRLTKCKFINIENLSVPAILYMNKYMKMWPDNFEFIMHKTQDDVVKFFYDLETTGTDANKHGIHQISGCIEVNGKVMENFNFRVKPHPDDEIVDAALEASNTTREDLDSFAEIRTTYKEVIKMLAHYCDRYNKKDKMYLIGFNNRKFDDQFFRAWFAKNGDQFFGSWFWSDSIDVMVLASQYLIGRRVNMPSFKLSRVAQELGLEVDESRLHDGEYDIELTRQIYQIVVGLEIE